MSTRRTIAAYAAAGITLLLLGGNHALAHCDGLDGPVVKAAQKALATNNVNLVLAWVQPGDEQELKSVFQQTLSVRKLSPDSKVLADRQFFETLVRLHRAGEGAPYTGLKPSGRNLGPAIPAADHAIESGDLDVLEKLLVSELRRNLHESFEHVQAKKKYDANDVVAGREYVKAYVEYIHFVERVHEASTKPAAGHFPEAESH